jgi:glycosyltransferase involved in cell wall biosynthesis
LFFSLAIPVYNEASALPRAVEAARAELEKIKGLRYEILIAEDGSTDATPRVAAALEKKFREVKWLHSEARLGKGASLSKAFRACRGGRGSIVAFMDADLATPPRFLRELVSLSRDFDVVVGSRYLSSSKAERSLLRRAYSWVYNWLVRVLFSSKLRDHQCGFKAFRREALLELLPRVRARHWFWDTEVLVLAQRAGLRVKEFPVEWDEKGRGGRSKVRLRDALGFIAGIAELRWRLWFG